MEGSEFKIRLVLNRKGAVEVQGQQVAPPKRLKVAGAAVDSAEPLLYHKTTHRAIYEQQLRTRPDCDDVVLHNERGELTESLYRQFGARARWVAVYAAGGGGAVGRDL